MQVMRRDVLITAALIGAMVAAGCGPDAPPEPPVAPPATAEDLASLRAAVQRSYPDANLGLVTSVLPDRDLAAVGDVATSEFGRGDVVTFVDSNQEPIAQGQVVRVLPQAIHVRYQPAETPAGRAPQTGDLAVRFRQ